MNISKKKLILSISLLGVFIATIIGISYAYVGVLVKGNTSPDPSMDIQTGYLAIKYTDGTTSLNTKGKVVGGTTLTKTFTVENTGVGTAFYSISFSDVVNPFVRTQDWTYVLKSGDTVISSGIVPTKDEVIVSARGLNVRTKDKLTLTVTYAKTNENQIEDINKTLEFNISVKQGISSFDLANEGTLLYYIGRNLSPKGGSQIYAMDFNYESAEDNYGTSYYFSGNPDNNYINYSGMCFRIVRILGNGNIKLVLADGNNLCNSEGYSKTNRESAFITISNYANEGSIADFANSNVLSILTNWVSNINSHSLVNTEWCNDTSIASESDNNIKYGAYGRLSDSDNLIPSLKCENKYNSNVGILTADEIIFAGAKANETTSHYLTDNAQGTYWTMSPYDKFIDINMWGVNEYGALVNIGNVTRNDIYIRPSIVINKDVMISGGNGTQANPYVIE